MEFIRFPDWEDRIRVYLDRVMEDPFKWGSHDCALFAADCLKAMTGNDPGEAFRGKYDTKKGAAEALRTYGQGTLFRTVKHWLGDPKCIHHAHRGDIVMRDRFTTGFCVGQFSWFVGQEQGFERLVPVPTKDCTYAFAVPYGPSEATA